MNQEKIGQFIATCRKEKGYTQAQLAEQLGITNRAVSKWENAKSMPDVTIMMELCEILDISVNELLSGEKLEMENYKENAEKNLIDLQSKKEKAEKGFKVVEGIFFVFVIMAFIANMVVNYYYPENNGVWLQYLTLIVAVGLLVGYFYRYYEIKLK